MSRTLEESGANVLNGLALTPFEWSMANEVSGSPMEFVVRVCCAGTIDVENWKQALLLAVSHQPLFQANAEIGPTNRTSFWRPAANLTPVIMWLTGDPSEGRGVTENFQPIDLGNEIGFRFYGWQYQIEDQPKIEMRFIFHHACCDGKGGLEFIDHLLCRYQQLIGDEPTIAMPSFDPNLLKKRDLRESQRQGVVDRFWRTFVVRPKRVANVLFSAPRLFCDAPDDGEDHSNDPPARQCSTTLSSEATRRLGHFAKSQGASTNVVLARELFQVLHHTWIATILAMPSGCE